MFGFASHPAIWAIVLFGLVYGAVRFLYKADTRREDRRRMAISLAGTTRQMGITIVAEFLEDYAVGDYDGIATKLVKWKHLTDEDPELKAKGREILAALFHRELRTPEGREHVASLFKDVGVKLQPEAKPVA